MSAAPVTVADLRPVDLFDDLDDEGLAAWAAVAEPLNADAGEVVIWTTLANAWIHEQATPPG